MFTMVIITYRGKIVGQEPSNLDGSLSLYIVYSLLQLLTEYTGSPKYKMLGYTFIQCSLFSIEFLVL